MIIFDNNHKPVILDSIYNPILTDSFWVLDLTMMDFALAPLNSLEEITCPTVTVEINGFRFHMPASWNILVFSPETLQLDVIDAGSSSGKEFTSFVYGPLERHYSREVIRVVDYDVKYPNIAPALNKTQMLCHPINPRQWINISPSDSYNKYLKDCVIGDLI